MAKYIFVTGGVVSGLGKGMTAASIAMLLKSRGYKVFMQKFDPYFNVDPGTMNPTQHGEVFVTYDGKETDLDLGHYERFIDEELNYTSNITSGLVYKTVIEKERRGDYLGATVQLIPHVVGEIKNKVYEAARTSGADIVITEIGGTVGDMESEVFLEAIRQIQLDQGNANTYFIHCTLVPYIYGSDELKTKPTQNSVRDLRNIGIRPDSVVLRVPFPSGDIIKQKIAMFGSVPVNAVIDAIDCENIYRLPLLLHEQGIDETILKHFGLEPKEAEIAQWARFADLVDSITHETEIALVGKYTVLHDAYLSVIKALEHAGYANNTKVHIRWIESEDLEKEGADLDKIFEGVQGIIVPGGFGTRGTEGIIKSIEYARTHEVPYLGICLGMQLAVVEFARDVCGLKGANSKELNPNTPFPVIDIMEDQKGIKNMGGTLRLGNFACHLKEGSKAEAIYEATDILERHRHRYEFNNAFKTELERNGLVFSGENLERGLMEIIELPSHPFFVAGQFHPEFKSRPLRPHPLFREFIAASLKK